MGQWPQARGAPSHLCFLFFFNEKTKKIKERIQEKKSKILKDKISLQALFKTDMGLI